MTTEIAGLIHITGAYNAGKTTLAITYDPLHTVMFDFERSAEGFVCELPVGKYYDMAGNGVALYNAVTNAFNSVPAGQFSVAIIDNISPLEQAIVAYVEQNPRQFGLTPGQVEKSNQLIYGPARQEFRRLLDVLHRAGCRTIIVTSQLQEKYLMAGRPSGIMYPRSMNTLAPLSSLTLWLRPRPASRVPSALVVKDRLGRPLWVTEIGADYVIVRTPRGEEKLSGVWYNAVVRAMRMNEITSLPAAVPVQRLPRRIPVCTWSAIRRYLDEPADWDNPAPGEVPDEEELRLLSGTLSPEQRDMLRLAVLDAEREAKTSRSEDDGDIPATAGELVARAIGELHLSPSDIVAALGRPAGEVDDFAAAWRTLQEYKK